MVNPQVVRTLIQHHCLALATMLVEKNRAYGNSALEPVRIFSKASATEQLLVRLDDKLSRLARGHAAGEDVILDLLGYLILYRVALTVQQLLEAQGQLLDDIAKGLRLRQRNTWPDPNDHRVTCREVDADYRAALLKAMESEAWLGFVGMDPANGDSSGTVVVQVQRASSGKIEVKQDFRVDAPDAVVQSGKAELRPFERAAHVLRSRLVQVNPTLFEGTMTWNTLVETVVSDYTTALQTAGMLDSLHQQLRELAPHHFRANESDIGWIETLLAMVRGKLEEEQDSEPVTDKAAADMREAVKHLLFIVRLYEEQNYRHLSDDDAVRLVAEQFDSARRTLLGALGETQSTDALNALVGRLAMAYNDRGRELAEVRRTLQREFPVSLDTTKMPLQELVDRLVAIRHAARSHGQEDSAAVESFMRVLQAHEPTTFEGKKPLAAADLLGMLLADVRIALSSVHNGPSKTPLKKLASEVADMVMGRRLEKANLMPPNPDDNEMRLAAQLYATTKCKARGWATGGNIWDGIVEDYLAGAQAMKAKPAAEPSPTDR